MGASKMSENEYIAELSGALNKFFTNASIQRMSKKDLQDLERMEEKFSLFINGCGNVLRSMGRLDA